VYRPFIYEFYVDEEGLWYLEFGFVYWGYGYWLSYQLETSASGFIYFEQEMLLDIGGCGYEFAGLLNNSMLEFPIFFDPDGGYINLTVDTDIGDYETMISYGNYPNAEYPCYQPGQTISEIDAWTQDFCITNNPTMGACNDYSGVYGHFSGVILDPTEEPFPGGFFSIPGTCQDISFDSNGNFDKEVMTGSYSFDTIDIFCSSYPFGSGKYVTEPVVFCLCPDSSFYCVVKTIDIITNITEPKVSYENTVTVSPNPFVEKATFYFNYDNLELNDQISLKIYTADGVLAGHEPLNTRQASFVWYPSEPIKSGMLVYHFIKNDQVIKTGKIIKH
jgi:hypothetical protein